MDQATFVNLARAARSTHRFFRFTSWYRKLFAKATDPTVILPVTMGDQQLPMELHLNDHVDFQLFYYGAFEPKEGELVKSLLKPGDIMIDLGANIGYYTIFAANLVGTTGEIHAFEPIPSTFARLATNTQLNNLQNVRLNQCAASDQHGTVDMYDFPGNSGSNSFGKHPEATTSFSVPTIRLDDYVKEHGLKKITLIKMDIEGAEVLALRGMHDVIMEYRPQFLIEVNSHCLSQLGFSVNDLVHTIQDYGYSIIDIKTQQPFVCSPELQHRKTDIHAIPR